MSLPQNPGHKLYFAYGSNLSSTQMKARCPSAVPVGLGHLPGWTWIINQRGYANIVQKSSSPAATATATAGAAATATSTATEMEGAGVYGVLYTLPPIDEAALDRCEHVPTAYEKATLDVEVVAARGAADGEANEYTQFEQTQLPALVYVDYHRVEADRPKAEYIARMNRGIDEARRDYGLPEWYITNVMRPFIKPKELTEETA
ncbi:hypothetical protein PG996_005389 [Apiospora saccharicola]|uniref:gamma-glutamylcyclotransferase n=1 Tax=Apiospora saccharicola TaxID=335842 RepID=A0ABR1VLB9_9PEZI